MTKNYPPRDMTKPIRPPRPPKGASYEAWLDWYENIAPGGEFNADLAELEGKSETMTHNLDLCDHETGEVIRPATLSEYIQTLSAGITDGAFELDGRSVYVGGDLDADDLAPLRVEAAAAGDLAMVELCDAALDGDPDALAECARALADAAAQQEGE